jgi:hypothetical protein
MRLGGFLMTKIGVALLLVAVALSACSLPASEPAASPKATLLSLTTSTLTPITTALLAPVPTDTPTPSPTAAPTDDCHCHIFAHAASRPG